MPVVRDLLVPLLLSGRYALELRFRDVDLPPRYAGFLYVPERGVRGLRDVPRRDLESGEVTPYDRRDFGVYDDRVFGWYAYFARDADVAP